MLAGLGGGELRVIVYDPGDVGIASGVDTPAEIDQAEGAAIDAANRSDSFADGAQAAVDVLAANDEAAAPSGGDDGGDGFPWGVVLLLLAVIAIVVVVVVWVLRRSSHRAEDAAERAGVQGAEVKVREVIDRISRRVLDLSDRLKVASRRRQRGSTRRAPTSSSTCRTTSRRPTRGRSSTRCGPASSTPTTSSRRPRRCSRASRCRPRPWSSPCPRRPPRRPRRPPRGRRARQPRAGPVTAPPPEERGYRGFDVSPWLTQAAIAAVTMLASQRGRSTPQHRDPMGGDVFGDVFGGLGPDPSWSGGRSSGGSRGRPRINIGGRGGRGRGMGRRR